MAGFLWIYALNKVAHWLVDCWMKHKASFALCYILHMTGDPWRCDLILFDVRVVMFIILVNLRFLATYELYDIDDWLYGIQLRNNGGTLHVLSIQNGHDLLQVVWSHQFVYQFVSGVLQRIAKYLSVLLDDGSGSE